LTAGGSELPVDASSVDLPAKISKIQSDIEENNRMRAAIGEKIDNFDVKSNIRKDRRKLIELKEKRTTLLQVSMHLQELEDAYVVMQQLVQKNDLQAEKFLLIQKARFRTGGLVTILFVPCFASSCSTPH
jgi:hypothetical protein